MFSCVLRQVITQYIPSQGDRILGGALPSTRAGVSPRHPDIPFRKSAFIRNIPGISAKVCF